MLGTWDEANVPNVGYVARILDEYYPNTDQPSSLTDEYQRAAAVQAAIWFFSDRFVLDTSDPLYSHVAAIADHVISEGPLQTPPKPSLTITPSNLSGPTGSVLGPYRVESSATTTVTSIGANMFSDAAATHSIPQGAVVPNGQQIWLKSTGASSAELEATAVATVPAGNVYLYDGGANAAQKLILSQTGTLTTIVDATADFETPGSLVVTKTITGTAAGKQAPVTIHTVCDGTALTDFAIAARATGNQSHTYTDIAAGSDCTVTETADGSTSTVSVTVIGSGQEVTIPSGSPVTAALTNTYSEVPGSLTVNKLIAGPAAGSQGAVTIDVVCNGTPVGEWTIVARQPPATYPRAFSGIAAGSSCTVTETADGSTDNVSVTTVGSPQTVIVGAGENAQANISDTYNYLEGSLTVTKTIAGPAAGHQEQVTIKVSCNGTELSPELTVPDGSPATNYSHTYTNIAAGSSCSAEEIANGATGDVAVTTTGDVGTPVTVPGGGTANLHITNTYDYASGSLLVTKNIDGAAAGSQGEVKITVTCGGTALDDFVISAGTKGLSQQTYDDIPAGSTCTVDETVDGSSRSVSVTIVGGSQSTTITAGQEAKVEVENTYDYKPGSLTVEKVVEGPGAGQQGQITITTTCVLNGSTSTLSPNLVVPTHSPAGTYRETYGDIPAGSECTAVASSDGSNAKVSDVEGGGGTAVTIPPGGTATFHLTDTYETGELVVNKTIEGPAAGLQGQVVVHTVCNGTALAPDLTVPANSVAGTYPESYSGIAVGSTCTVTETSDGGSSTVHVDTVGSGQTVSISPNGTASAVVTDSYSQVPGSLVVTKDIRGPAAGDQGPVAVAVSCDDGTVGSFDIATRVTGPQSKTFRGIQAGSDCKVTETADGSTSTVDVIVTGDGQTVTVPADGTANATIIDSYTHANGSLSVSKTIEGPGAGEQGEIVISVSCDGNQLPDLVIPAGQAAGTYTQDYTDLPAGSVCTVLETSDGNTSTVTVRQEGSGTEVTVPAGREATVDLTDTYETGALVVNKTITGGAAGSQGDVHIDVGCNEAGVETPQPSFIIPAGTPAGTVSMPYPNILAGSTCTLTETANGATETATATTTGGSQSVVISDNGSATANVTNQYEYVPGGLIVTKDIAGPAAGQQGQISIGVSCVQDGTTTSYDPFVIPAGSSAGSYEHEYTDIPVGSSCTVSETEDGSTSTVSVTTVGGDQTVSVPPRDEAVANISNTYHLVAGSLTVNKTIAGAAAGLQGR